MASPLQGSCTCGRNHYAILIPSEATARQEFEIFFDNRTENAYLRVPLSRYQSFTTAFYPDETHSSIRRMFTPQHAPHSQQIFCGLCGSHLSFWTEEPPTEAQYLSVAISTMKGRDLERLEDLGVTRPEVDDAVDADVVVPANGSTGPMEMTESTPATESSDSTITHGTSGGLSWIQAARTSGGLKTRRGIGKSSDGTTTVEWEVSEYTDSDPSSTGARGKRKIGDVGAGEDAEME